jgi:histone acetyltransferase (RNA polymerase elongator complex component)
MKDSKTIISHLKKHPSLKTLEQEECFDVLIKLLPNSLSNFIKFIYTKHDTLFFVLNHPSAKMEFNYKRNLIKEILNKIEKFHPNCKCINLKEVKAFVSNKKELQEEKKIETRIFYEERSNGTFKNNTKNERLHTLFEEIRKEIEKNND